MFSASMRGGIPGSSDVSIDALLPEIERMRGEGAIVLLKWDGERTADVTTIVITRGEYFFRTDSDDIERTLRKGIADYRANFPADSP